MAADADDGLERMDDFGDYYIDSGSTQQCGMCSCI